jgi:hypothetical protein
MSQRDVTKAIVSLAADDGLSQAETPAFGQITTAVYESPTAPSGIVNIN